MRKISAQAQRKVIKYLEHYHTIIKIGHEKGQKIIDNILPERLKDEIYLEFFG